MSASKTQIENALLTNLNGNIGSPSDLLKNWIAAGLLLPGRSYFKQGHKGKISEYPEENLQRIQALNGLSYKQITKSTKLGYPAIAACLIFLGFVDRPLLEQSSNLLPQTKNDIPWSEDGQAVKGLLVDKPKRDFTNKDERVLEVELDAAIAGYPWMKNLLQFEPGPVGQSIREESQSLPLAKIVSSMNNNIEDDQGNPIALTTILKMVLGMTMNMDRSENYRHHWMNLDEKMFPSIPFIYTIASMLLASKGITPDSPVNLLENYPDDFSWIFFMVVSMVSIGNYLPPELNSFKDVIPLAASLFSQPLPSKMTEALDIHSGFQQTSALEVLSKEFKEAEKISQEAYQSYSDINVIEN